MKLWKAAVACVVTATSHLKKSEESLKSDFFSGGRRLRHRLSCSYSHKLATSSSGSSSPPSCISVSLTFFDNLWSFIEGNFEGNFERKFYCVAFEKKYYRNDFVIKLAWLTNRKLPTVGIQELLRPISVKHSDGFQLPLSNRKQDRVLSSTLEYSEHSHTYIGVTSCHHRFSRPILSLIPAICSWCCLGHCLTHFLLFLVTS